MLGLNGNAITMRPDLARAVNPASGLGDPASVGAALKAHVEATGRKLRFGVVHRYSSHNYMLRYWLAACDVQPQVDVEITTVAPPFCADALEHGEVDAICVGEPWNSVAVERGAGEIVLVTAQIWRRGVEKVLAFRERVMEERRGEAEALVRALRKAGEHFVDPANLECNAAILARPEYLDGDATLIGRAISDRLLLAQGGEVLHYPDFMFQHREAANFPWVSQSEWLYSQMVRWDGLEFSRADAAKAARVFRPDVYRSALLGTGDPLPGASSKVEGSLQKPTSVSMQQGVITLENNSFFDGKPFDPELLQSYIESQRQR